MAGLVPLDGAADAGRAGAPFERRAPDGRKLVGFIP
jgi:hypothetical protein